MRKATIITALGLVLLLVAIGFAATGLDRPPPDLVGERFGLIDRDGDGFVTPAEARGASAGLATHFDKFDRDHDGQLSLTEFRRHAAPADG